MLLHNLKQNWKVAVILGVGAFLGSMLTLHFLLPLPRGPTLSAPAKAQDQEGIIGTYEGQLRWWLDTGWTKSTWSLPMQLVLSQQEGKLYAEVTLRKKSSAFEMVEAFLPQTQIEKLSPPRSLFDPPEVIKVEVVPRVEGEKNIVLSFPYEDPTTWLDVKVEMVLQPSGPDYQALLGNVKGSFLKGKVMQGTATLAKVNAEGGDETGK